MPTNSTTEEPLKDPPARVRLRPPRTWPKRLGYYALCSIVQMVSTIWQCRNSSKDWPVQARGVASTSSTESTWRCCQSLRSKYSPFKPQSRTRKRCSYSTEMRSTSFCLVPLISRWTQAMQEGQNCPITSRPCSDPAPWWCQTTPWSVKSIFIPSAFRKQGHSLLR